jgi:predicted ATPase/transcriptional regulator with XRE-family HTH domain
MGDEGEFGRLLHQLRRERDLTQEDLGRAAFCSRDTIKKLEAGVRRPSRQLAAQLADVLGLEDPTRTTFLVAARVNRALGEGTASESIDQAPEPTPPGAAASILSVVPLDQRASILSRRVQNNLPAQLTRFIGRERAIADVQALLQHARLLTLTGSGGTGKTRLALEVAAAVTPNFADGIWLVELAALSDGAMVADTVAKVFGLPAANQPTLSMLAHFLRDQRMLLLLDNCEHIIQACAELAEALLRACAELHILATSREGLGVAGELVWPVPTLLLPGAEAHLTSAQLSSVEAVRLFIDRATLVSPGFALTDTNATAVRQICTRLDGIPLAIELAAARVKALTVQEIAARLGDRFRLLTGGSRTVLPRHQTLRALIDWSYRLLTEPERVVLRRLAVFAGGWTLEAAEAVCSGDGIDAQDVLDLHTRLVDKSLVVPDLRSTETRYTFLETIRQYLIERLEDAEESATVRNRHLDHILLTGERVAPLLGGEVLNDRSTRKSGEGGAIDQVTVYTHLSYDLENIRRAADWAAETGRIDEGLRLLIAFGAFFIVRAGQKELLARLRAMLAEHVPQDGHTHALACLWIAHVYQRQSELDLGRVWVDTAETLIAQLGNPALQFSLLFFRMHDAVWHGDYGRTRSYHAQRQHLALAHASFGMDKAEIEAVLAWHFGALLVLEGEHLQAGPPLKLAYAYQATRGNMYASTAMARFLGYVFLTTGNPLEAAAHFRESLIGNFALGDKQAVAACLAALAADALVGGDLARAARLFGASEALQEAISTPLLTWDVEQLQHHIEAVRQKLPRPELDVHWTAGRAMSMEQAIDDALTLYPSEQKERMSARR